jgi:hypothetical protein
LGVAIRSSGEPYDIPNPRAHQARIKLNTTAAMAGRVTKTGVNRVVIEEENGVFADAGEDIGYGSPTGKLE